MPSRLARPLALLLPLALAPGCGFQQVGSPVSFIAATQDLGVGGDLQTVLAAPAAAQPAAADALWAQKDASDFTKRAAALAAGITARPPDVLAVQSAMQWRHTPPASGVEATVADYLDLFVAALAARGYSYTPVATQTTADLTLTGAAGDVYRVIDREAILVRAGVATSAPASGTFVAHRTVTIGGAAVPYLRGWASVQVAIEGKSFRLVSTHLDSVDAATQNAQATELVRVVGTGSVVVAGDLGAGPGGGGWGGYDLVLAPANGLTDAVSSAGAGLPTCCRDDACVDPTATLDRRFDVILASQDMMGYVGARILGDPSALVNGLWPSPHAGVRAEIHFE